MASRFDTVIRSQSVRSYLAYRLLGKSRDEKISEIFRRRIKDKDTEEELCCVEKGGIVGVRLSKMKKRVIKGVVISRKCLLLELEEKVSRPLLPLNLLRS